MSNLVERRYLLMKRGLYYRPDNSGYTGIKDHAGRYLESDASADCGVAAIHEDEAPDFSPACFDDLAREHLQAKLQSAATRIEHLEALVVKMAEALRDCLATIDDYLSYTHSGDPWEEDARAMGEMDINDFGSDGRLDRARSILSAYQDTVKQ